MKILVKNVNWSLRLCLNLLKFVGFLIPTNLTKNNRVLLNFYWFFWMMFVVGIGIVTQTGDLYQVWGNLPLMTGTSFLLFTNMAFGTKIFNVVIRKRAIQLIIDDTECELRSDDRQAGRKIIRNCDRETTRHLYLYLWLSAVTVFGWAASAEKNKLPLRAWYPYSASTSPGYELTYVYQSVSVILAATLNVCLDTLVTSLIAVCRCRLRLLGLSLRTLCQDIVVIEKDSLTFEDEKLVADRLRSCVSRHQAALNAASQIQACFSEPILAQFTVSTIIICVTAYQLAVEIQQKNMVRVISMAAYLLCMALQVFLYCYQGNQLAEESSEIARDVYQCPWYLCSVKVRRAIFLIMLRSHRVAQLTAGGLATLSLACFAAIIKASYTFFTVLQRVEDRGPK